MWDTIYKYMICKWIVSWLELLNDLGLICSHTHLNGFKYCYPTLIETLFFPSWGRVDTVVWRLTNRIEKKHDGNFTRMLRAIVNKSWRQQPTKQRLFGHLPPITKTIKVRRTRYARHCGRSRDELISDILLWTPSHGRAKAGRPTRTYIQHLYAYTGCSIEDRPETMDDREGWLEMCWWRDMIMMMMMNSFICTQLNGFKHCYIILIILFAHS